MSSLANTFLAVNDLDFNNIKTNLKNFLKTKNEFTDYDFEASTMSTLLDVLAYNTYYNTYYLNMSVNEDFIDSALLRENVVARAKGINYIPRSTKSSKTKLNINIIPEDGPTEIIIPAYTKFTSTTDNIVYNFSTYEDYIFTNDGDGNFSGQIEIFEGEILNYTFTVDTSVTNRYVLNNSNLDTDSLLVSVKQNSGSTEKTYYTLYDNLVNIKSDSTVYFLEENLDENYEIYFGDGILGKNVSNNNIINITARFTNADEANGLNIFKAYNYVGYNKDVPTTQYSAASIEAVTKTYGGQPKEDIESIKYAAPKFFAMQNRLITKEDYKAYISSKWGDLESVSVWGGEDNDPPLYGKALISVKPKNGFVISNVRRQEIIDDMVNKNSLSIDPVLIDPIFTFINTLIRIDFDSSKTTLTPNQIYNKISTNIKSFEQKYLSNFEKGFYLSKFMNTINSSDNSILNSDVNFYLEKRLYPIFNSSLSYKINFNTKIKHPYEGYLGAFSSKGFYYSGNINLCYFDDDGVGNIRIYYNSTNKKTYINNKAGTINYNEGLITLDSIIFSSLDNDLNELRVFIEPDNNLYNSINNEILLLSYPAIKLFDIKLNNIVYNNVVEVNGNLTPIQTTTLVD